MVLLFPAAKNNTLQGYYDERNNPADAPEITDRMPTNVDLVFWDYYHTSPEIYTQKLHQHRELGCQQPWVACKLYKNERGSCGMI